MIVPPRGRIPETSLRAEIPEPALDEAAPALEHGDAVPALGVGRADDRADHRVQPGAVAAAREDPDRLRHAS